MNIVGYWSGKAESWEHSKVSGLLQREWPILEDVSLWVKIKWDPVRAYTYTVSLSLQFRYDRNILHILCIVIWSHLFSSFRWGSSPILLAQTNENSHRHRPRFKVSVHRVAASFRYIRAELQFSIRYRRFYPQGTCMAFLYKLNFEIHFRQLLMTWQKSFLWAGWRRRLLKPYRRHDVTALTCTWVWERRSALPVYTRPCSTRRHRVHRPSSSDKQRYPPFLFLIRSVLLWYCI